MFQTVLEASIKKLLFFATGEEIKIFLQVRVAGCFTACCLAGQVGLCLAAKDLLQIIFIFCHHVAFLASPCSWVLLRHFLAFSAECILLLALKKTQRQLSPLGLLLPDEQNIFQYSM